MPEDLKASPVALCCGSGPAAICRPPHQLVKSTATPLLMQNILRVLFWISVVGGAIAIAQTSDGQIAGRINDRRSAAPIPGVRITITNGDQSREAITDSEGRFVLRSLTMGTYRVVAELPGFTSTSGEIRLAPSGPRAYLAWALEVACIEEDVRISLGARKAAAVVDAILHLRVISADGSARMSLRPECASRLVREYSVLVLGSASGRDRTPPGQRRIFMSTRDAGLKTGEEYLALLWPDGRATDDLVFPIISGLVASPHAGEVNGMSVDEALKVLGNWSQERQR